MVLAAGLAALPACGVLHGEGGDAMRTEGAAEAAEAS